MGGPPLFFFFKVLIHYLIISRGLRGFHSNLHAFFSNSDQTTEVFKKKATNGALQVHDYTVLTDSTKEVKDGAVPSSCLSCPAVVVFVFFFV